MNIKIYHKSNNKTKLLNFHTSFNIIPHTKNVRKRMSNECCAEYVYKIKLKTLT